MSIRWDAVVKKNALRCSGRMAEAAGAAPDAIAAVPEAARTGAPVEIQVWLFGMMAGPMVTNPLRLQFAEGCTLRDVFDELGRRLGPAFMRTLVGDSGEALNTCRIFLDGEPVKGMAASISGGRTASMEIILLREIEGG